MPRSLAEVEGVTVSVDRRDFAGNWQEDWPGRPEDDAYRIALNGDKISLEVLSNPDRQALGDMEWNGRRLNFELYYNDIPYQYELFLVSNTQLVGLVSAPSGGCKRVVWNRVGPRRTSSWLRTSTWNGRWREYWPQRGEHDAYRLQVSRGAKIVVEAMTNQAKQSLAGVRFNGKTLSFQVRFGENTIVYELRLDDSNTIRGTARTQDGQSRPIVWLREK